MSKSWRENPYNYCDECIDLDLPNFVSPPIKRLKTIFDILKKKTKLPNEIILIIIEKTCDYTICSKCQKIKLCNYHTQRAQYYGHYYGYGNTTMCGNCCWVYNT